MMEAQVTTNPFTKIAIVHRAGAMVGGVQRCRDCHEVLLRAEPGTSWPQEMRLVALGDPGQATVLLPLPEDRTLYPHEVQCSPSDKGWKSHGPLPFARRRSRQREEA